MRCTHDNTYSFVHLNFPLLLPLKLQNHLFTFSIISTTKLKIVIQKNAAHMSGVFI